MSTEELSLRLKAEATRLGFDQVGIAPAVAPPGYPDFLRWLEAGRAAGMEYMHRQAPGRAHPEALLDGVRSVVMVSMIYGSDARRAREAATQPTAGKVARYARGADYHRVLWDKLGLLLDWLRVESPESRGRAVADTAPLLERDYARLAGLGWIGKNTMLISRRLGSFTFLGALLTDLELVYDAPHAGHHCGTCTRCLEACPTDAFAGPYELDARRCISYWTIEHRGPIPDQAAEQLHGWVFGCDICQDVCPWNRKAPSGRNPDLAERPEWVDPDLLGWLADDRETWRARLKGTALERARRNGLVRNAALVLGSRGVAEAVGPLAARLDDLREDPVVRSAAARALARVSNEAARAALMRHRDDPDPAILAAARSAGVDPSAPPGHEPAGDPAAETATGSPPVDEGRPARIGEDPGRDA
jgi:epoxyqueuosine reductase